MAGLTTHRAATAPAPSLLGGLLPVLRSQGTLWWSYTFGLGLALLFSLDVYSQFSDLTAHSLASAQLTSGFDVVTLITGFMRLHRDTPASGSGPIVGGLLLAFAVRFLLVPGTLYAYHAGTPGKLSILVGRGLAFFWRFVRITLLAGLCAAVLLGLLLALILGAASHYNDAHAGNGALYLRLGGAALLFLVASLLRLYFDLVEVYTVQLDDHLRDDGRPDRRIRRVLRPALRTLGAHFWRAWLGFAGIAAVGLLVTSLLSRSALFALGSTRTWPLFLLVQGAALALRVARLWQRGMETRLAAAWPLVEVEPALATTAVLHHDAAVFVEPEPLPAVEPASIDGAERRDDAPLS